MRGELDDALARMARREELLRRRAAQPTEGHRPPAEGARPAAEGTRPSAEDDRYPTDGTRSPVEDVAEAIRRVVTNHPGLTVSLTVEQGTSHAALRVGWSTGIVTVTPAAGPVAPVTPPGPPAWPLTVQTVPGWAAVADDHAGDSAARLAELIRRDPSLLRGSQGQP